MVNSLVIHFASLSLSRSAVLTDDSSTAWIGLFFMLHWIVPGRSLEHNWIRLNEASLEQRKYTSEDEGIAAIKKCSKWVLLFYFSRKQLPFLLLLCNQRRHSFAEQMAFLCSRECIGNYYSDSLHIRQGSSDLTMLLYWLGWKCGTNNPYT